MKNIYKTSNFELLMGNWRVDNEPKYDTKIKKLPTEAKMN